MRGAASRTRKRKGFADVKWFVRPPREEETGRCQGGEAQGDRTGTSDEVGSGTGARDEVTVPTEGQTAAKPDAGRAAGHLIELARDLAYVVVAAIAAGDAEAAWVALGRLASVVEKAHVTRAVAEIELDAAI